MASKTSRADRRKFSGEANIFHNDVSRASRTEISRAEKASVAYSYIRGTELVKCNPDGTEDVIKQLETSEKFTLRDELSL